MWASCKSDRNVIPHEVAEVRKLQVFEGLRNLVSNLFPNECPSILLAESMIQDDGTYSSRYLFRITYPYFEGLLDCRNASPNVPKPNRNTEPEVAQPASKQLLDDIITTARFPAHLGWTKVPCPAPKWERKWRMVCYNITRILLTATSYNSN
jgi:hypothetical protein